MSHQSAVGIHKVEHLSLNLTLKQFLVPEEVGKRSEEGRSRAGGGRVEEGWKQRSNRGVGGYGGGWRRCGGEEEGQRRDGGVVEEWRWGGRGKMVGWSRGGGVAEG